MSEHETPAETIRRAIEQMREAANVAWADGDLDWYKAVELAFIFSRAAQPASKRTERDPAYIASWSPAVALAVADLLEALLARYDAVRGTFAAGSRAGAAVAAAHVHGFDAALRLARTYLGETP